MLPHPGQDGKLTSWRDRGRARKVRGNKTKSVRSEPRHERCICDIWGVLLIRQGSLHYTPEHCLVIGGFSLFWWNKPCFKWAKMYLLRSPGRFGAFRLVSLRCPKQQ